MQPPTKPRPDDFGLSQQDTARIDRLWLPPITGEPREDIHTASIPLRLNGEPENTSRLVRALRLETVAGAGGICGAIFGLGWTALSSDSLIGIFLIGFFAIVWCGFWGALIASVALGLLVRPLYIAAAFLFVPGFAQYANFKRALARYAAKLKEYDHWRLRTRVEYWRSLSGYAFEREVAGLYKRSGYQVTLTPASSDGGVDIILHQSDNVTAVQCKAIKGKVGISVGRELVTAARDFGATQMMIACTNGVSPQLYAYANDKAIQIVTAEDLVKMQAKLDGMPFQQITIERTHDIVARLRAMRRSKRRA